MTDKELKRLSRRELLEIMYKLREKLDELQSENERLKEGRDLSDAELFRLTAKRIERLYADRFGTDSVGEEESAEKEEGSENDG